MKQITIIMTAIVALLFLGENAYGQVNALKKKSHSVSLSKPGQSGKLKISGLSNDLIVKPHSQRDIKIEVEGYQPPPEKAKGLRPLSRSGVDNTGVGLSVQEVNNVVSMSEATHQNGGGKYTVFVPENVSIHIDYGSWGEGEDIHIEGISQEVEVNAHSSDVSLKSITGPAVVYTMGGDVDIVFSKVNQDNPIAISTMGGDMDLTLPSGTPANMFISSMGGEVYTDLDLKADESLRKKGKNHQHSHSHHDDDEEGEEEEEEEEGEEEEDDCDCEDMQHVGGHNHSWGGGLNFTGTLNGGGVKFKLQSMGGNIYLRKTK